MNGIVKYLCVVVGIGIVPPLDRDRVGTSAVHPIDVASQLQKWKEPASAGSFDAERAGFEPAVQFDPYAALAKRCFRPLSHLSEACFSVVSCCFSLRTS